MNGPAADPERFRCDTSTVGGSAVVCPHGELDLATEPLVETELVKLRDAGFEDLVLDLRGVSYLDSSGLRLLVMWNRAAQIAAWRFSVVPGSENVQRVIELASLDRVLTFVAPDALG